MIKRLRACAIVFLIISAINLPGQTAPNLGSTANFAIFTASGSISNSGGTTITGDLGTNSGSISGFPPGVVVGSSYVANAVTSQAATDANTAYSFLSGQSCGPTLGTTLGSGQVLTPNIYCITAPASLTGSLVLDGQGNSNSVFIIKINGGLTTANSSSVVLINGASICNVFWQINGAFITGNNSTFRGTIFANGKLDFGSNTILLGRGISLGGLVSFKSNVITKPVPPVASTITANGSTTLCAGGSVTLTGNNGGTWSNGAITSAITVTSSGSFYVTNTANCGSITSNTIIVTVNPLPTITVNSGSICAGAALTLTASGAATYTWAPATGLSGTTGSTVAASPSVTTVYTVTGTSAAGCVRSNTTSVTVVGNPTITVSSATICPGGQATLTATGATTFTWSPGTGLNATNGPTVISSPSVTSVFTVTGTASTCTSSATSTVTVSPSPTIIVNSDTVCAGGTVTLTASGANTYSWSPATGLNATTGNTVTATPPNTITYSITGSSTAGCIGMTTATVTVLANPTITVNNAAVCAGESATLTANGATNYTWSAAAGLSGTTGSVVIATPSVTTVYTITGSDGNCSSSITQTVTVNPLPVPSVTANGSLVFCQGDSVALIASTANSYTWSSGANTQSISVNTGGNYSVTVTDSNGCTGSSTAISVTVNPLPVISVNDAVICNGSAVTLTASGASTFTWSPGTGLNATTGASVVANPTTTTVYTISGTSASGCTATANSTVTVVPSLTVTVNSATICAGQSASLIAGGANSFSWIPSSSLSSTIGAVVVANPSTTTVYTITANAGVCTSTITTTVVVNPLPTPSISITGSTVFCQGGSATLTASGGTSFAWSNNVTTSSVVITSSGDYSVTVTDTNGCAANTSASITVNPLPTITVNSGTICPGGSLTLTAGGASTFTWSPTTGLSSATGATVLANPTVTTIYTISATSAEGCINTQTAEVTVLPTLTLTVNSATICSGNSATLIASGASSFSWSAAATLNTGTGSTVIATPSTTTTYTITGSTGACSSTITTTVVVNPLPTPSVLVSGSTSFCPGGSATLTANSGVSFMWSTGAITQSIVVNASGNYSVTVTDANGCSNTSASASITVNSLPTITVNSGTMCPAGSVTLIASGANTYTWLPPSGLNITNGATVIANPTVTTTYTVSGSNSLGCVNTETAQVVIIPNPTVTVNSATICNGSSATLTASGAASYTWDPPTGLSGTTGSTVVASPTLTTVYTVTGTTSGCSSVVITTVVVNPLPTPSITAAGSATFCQGDSVLLTGSGGNSYLWSNGATTSTINASTSGNYSVTVTNANGCSATSSVVVVVVNPLPTASISASGSTTLCQGGFVILTASQGSSYLWSNSATTQTIMVSNNGNFSVTVTDVNGCSNTSSATTVMVNILPTASIAVTGPTLICQGNSATLTASQGSSYLWSNGATTQSIAAINSGTYSVIVTNSAGCSAESEVVTLTVYPSPYVNLGPDTASCGCIFLTAYNPGATYQWSSGQNYAMITVCNSGTYAVSVSNGICISKDTINVIINPVPNVNISVITGSVTTLNAGNPGASYLWNTGDTTQSIIASNTGIYYVTVTNQFGCIGSDTTMVGVVGINANSRTTLPLKVYPNPTYNKTFTLSFEATHTSAVKIRVLSTLGITLYDEKVENFNGIYSKEFDMQNLAEGIYFIEVINGDKRSVIKLELE